MSCSLVKLYVLEKIWIRRNECSFQVSVVLRCIFAVIPVLQFWCSFYVIIQTWFYVLLSNLHLTMILFFCCSWSYIFIHYALLVAYVARSSEILTNFLGIPLYGPDFLFFLSFSCDFKLGGLYHFGKCKVLIFTVCLV